jgi:hypothetical protein
LANVKKLIEQAILTAAGRREWWQCSCLRGYRTDTDNSSPVPRSSKSLSCSVLPPRSFYPFYSLLGILGLTEPYIFMTGPADVRKPNAIKLQFPGSLRRTRRKLAWAGRHGPVALGTYC